MTRLPLAPPYAGPDMPSERAAWPVYRLIAHAPRLVPLWYRFTEGLEHDAETSRELQALLVIRTAQLAGSDSLRNPYRDTGVPDEKLRELANWHESDAFDERERAALRCADEMHQVALSDEAFAELERVFSSAEIVEIVFRTAVSQAAVRIHQSLGSPDHHDRATPLRAPPEGSSSGES